MLWAVTPPFKPALAQPDDEGAGYAEAQLGPGKRVHLPAIDNENGWETWAQMQNVGTADTGVVVFFWGDYSEKCPANDPGPIDTACMPILGNAVWTLKATIPSQAKSAIAYSVATTVFREACEDADEAVGDTSAWQAWEDIYGGTGEPLAVVVQRTGQNDFGTVISSAYPGLTESMHGEGSPYQYFTPYAMRRYHNLYTQLVIQNSGDKCTAVSIDYKEQGSCVFERVQYIEQLAPGESVRRRVPDEIKCEWLGSAYVQASQPLSIIVDQTSFSKYCPDSDDRGTLLTYWAQPYRPASDTLAYADLLFRAWSGWQAGIQVQNLTQESLPTFVTVDFMDNSGGELLFLGDWICPNGATTFFLPAITDLSFDYVGAADIQSHTQVDYPSGRETDGQPISAVVDVKKVLVYSDTFDKWVTASPGEAQGGSYNANPLSAKRGWGYIALPSISKSDEVTSTIAIRNNSNCNRIQLQANIHDSTGAKHTMISNLWLGPKQLRLIDLANIGTVVPGFIGAGVVEVTSAEQLCDTDGDGHIDPEPVMPSVIVLNKGHPSGDITTTYEGIPFKKWDAACRGDIMGKVHSIDPCHEADIDAAGPIEGVMVTSDDGVTDTTNSTGGYELKDVTAEFTRTVTFAGTGFLTDTKSIYLDCGEDKLLDASLLCLGDAGFKVVASIATDENSSSIAGATVEYSKPLAPKAAHYGDYYRTSGTTDARGVLTLTVPILNATGTFTVSAPGIAETGIFTWTQMVNTPTVTGTNSIFGGPALNSRIYSDTARSDTGMWYGLDDGSCANIGSSSRRLNNQDVELMLCGYGTVAGKVEVGGVAIPDQLVEVIVNGEVVGSATTGAAGTYIIGGIPTRCFSTAGCGNFSVRCMGWTENDKWEGCGDFAQMNFEF
ncbi:MAG: hypothetical protein ACE5I2_01455 [Anaerolineae bacterium]